MVVTKDETMTDSITIIVLTRDDAVVIDAGRHTQSAVRIIDGRKCSIAQQEPMSMFPVVHIGSHHISGVIDAIEKGTDRTREVDRSKRSAGLCLEVQAARPANAIHAPESDREIRPRRNPNSRIQSGESRQHNLYRAVLMSRNSATEEHRLNAGYLLCRHTRFCKRQRGPILTGRIVEHLEPAAQRIAHARLVVDDENGSFHMASKGAGGRGQGADGVLARARSAVGGAGCAFADPIATTSAATAKSRIIFIN